MGRCAIKNRRKEWRKSEKDTLTEGKGHFTILRMKRDIFQQITQDQIFVLDGAMGTNLASAGMPANGCTEQWVCEHPRIVQELQKQYLDAGTVILYAATFGANRARLSSYGLEDEIVRYNTVPVQIAKEIAVPGQHIVAGDISMSTMMIDFEEEDEVEEMKEVFREQARILEDAGVDILVVETMINLDEAKTAVAAAREVSDLPIMATMTFESNGFTLYGNSPEQAAEVLAEAGADAVGANCSTGPDKMIPVVEKMASAVKLPIIAKPNAGTPQPGPNGTVFYNMLEDEFAVYIAQLVEAGANLVGGCCGTTPEYIRKINCLSQNMSFVSKR